MKRISNYCYTVNGVGSCLLRITNWSQMSLVNTFCGSRFLLADELIPAVIKRIEKEYGPQIQKIGELAFALKVVETQIG